MLNSYPTACNYVKNSNLSVGVGLNILNAFYYSVRRLFLSATRKDENYVCLDVCVFVG
jgi:hypothetical protein